MKALNLSFKVSGHEIRRSESETLLDFFRGGKILQQTLGHELDVLIHQGREFLNVFISRENGHDRPGQVRRKRNEVGDQRVGCGQLLMFWKGGNAILVDILPELVPPAFREDEGSQAEDDLCALWGPAHSRTTQPLFDQSFACGLCDA